MIKHFCDRCKSEVSNKDIKHNNEPYTQPNAGEGELCPGCHEDWQCLSDHIQKLRHSYSYQFDVMKTKFMDGVSANDVIMDS